MDIIVDLDGTLANCDWRLHYIKAKPKYWKAFFEGIPHDKPIEPIRKLVFSYLLNGHQVIFCTGRPDNYETETVQWIEDHITIPCPPLYMRPKGDHEPDYVVKKRLLAKMRADGFNPTLAIDDKKEVCEMFEAEGLVVLKVMRKTDE